MRVRRRWRSAMLGCFVMAGAAVAGATGVAKENSPAADFTSAMDAAMARMDRDMMVPPSGSPDRDFAAMMIPHHQGAIDMAEAELRFGQDPVLRRLAQGIIVEQRQEIQVMQQALAALPPSANTAAPAHSRHKEH